MRKQRMKVPKGLTTWVPASLRRDLKLYCTEHDVRVQVLIREAIEEALREKRKPSDTAAGRRGAGQQDACICVARAHIPSSWVECGANRGS